MTDNLRRRAVAGRKRRKTENGAFWRLQMWREERENLKVSKEEGKQGEENIRWFKKFMAGWTLQSFRRESATARRQKSQVINSTEHTEKIENASILVQNVWITWLLPVQTVKNTWPLTTANKQWSSLEVFCSAQNEELEYSYQKDTRFPSAHLLSVSQGMWWHMCTLVSFAIVYSLRDESCRLCVCVFIHVIHFILGHLEVEPEAYLSTKPLKSRLSRCVPNRSLVSAT